MSDVAHNSLAHGWHEDDRHDLFVSRESLLIQAHRAGFLAITSTFVENSSAMYGLISLVQEGHFILDPQTPGLLQLTETGQNFAAGVTALQYGSY